MEKIQEMFNQDLEELKSKQTMMNNTINEIKNTLEGHLRTRGGGMVSWDEVREWHGHMYTTKCKINS